jgi:hypothetical protein
MPIVISGSGTITGISAGGLPDAIITTAELVDANVTQAKLETLVVPIGVGQTWQSVTGSRALLTNYTNSTGKPIQVYIVCTGGSSNGATLTIAGNTPAQLYTNIAGGRVGLFCIIPNSTVYQLGDSGATIHSWWELR